MSTLSTKVIVVSQFCTTFWTSFGWFLIYHFFSSFCFFGFVWTFLLESCIQSILELLLSFSYLFNSNSYTYNHKNPYVGPVMLYIIHTNKNINNTHAIIKTTTSKKDFNSKFSLNLLKALFFFGLGYIKATPPQLCQSDNLHCFCIVG